ncbi:AraC family transcriptional regulator [Pseudoxanthomonas mexicana]
MDHIQRHPDGDLSLTALAQLAHFSPFHFHRVFRAHTGQTLQAFVARSRLDRALFVMRSSPRKRLSQVAADCGFESPSTFSKAFRKAYGVSPSRADINMLLRRDVNALKCSKPSVPSRRSHGWRVSVQMRDALELAAVRVTGGYLRPQTLVDGYLRLQAWIDENGIERNTSLLLGMSMDDPDIVPLEDCRYDFACTVPATIKRESGIRRTQIPAAHWATLNCVGDISIVEDAWTHLFRDWLPTSGWQAAALPAIEIFHQRPEVIGWDRFDLDCCLPVVPLAVG